MAVKIVMEGTGNEQTGLLQSHHYECCFLTCWHA